MNEDRSTADPRHPGTLHEMREPSMEKDDVEPTAAAIFGAMMLAGSEEPLDIGPVPVHSPDTLPLLLLGDDRFERLAHWWAQEIDGCDDARIHGTSGVADFGIDVLARRPNGRYWAYQCKCHKDFDPTKLSDAVKKFFEHAVADIERFMIFVACEGTHTGLQPTLDRLRQQHPGVELHVLYQGNLSNTLQRHYSKVAQMFGRAWANAFCQPEHSRHGRVQWPVTLGSVPVLADSFQVRREAQQLLSATGTTSVLCGAGGVGKTQVAAYVAHQLWMESRLDCRLWINASSQESLVSGYAAASARLGQAGDQGDDVNARRFLEWLDSTTASWLVVLDDLSDPADLNDWWPPARATGRVIVTTRRRDASLSAAGRERLDVALFTEREASEYVEAKLRNHPYLADNIAGVVQDLGMMPLALAQAAAFMIDEGLTCGQYRRRFASVSSTLEDLVPEALPDAYNKTLTKTWMLSIEAADRREPQGMASRLLRLASVLDPAGIPRAVLLSVAARSWLKVGKGRATEEQVHQAAQCLQRFSLATHDQSGPAPVLRVHALVQRVARETAKGTVLRRAAVCAANAITEIWPAIEIDREFGQALRGNAAALAASQPSTLWTDAGPHPVLIQIGASLHRAGHFQAEADYFRTLKSEAQQRLGPDHPGLLDVRDHYIDAQVRNENRQWAIDEFDILVKDSERILGPDHPKTLSIRNSRAEWLDGRAQVDAFETLLTDCHRVMDADDPFILYTRERLVIARGMAGDVEGALADAESVLKDQLRINGPGHVDTLGARHNVAAWKGQAGDLAGSLADFENLFADSLPVLGPYHHNMVDIRVEIAQLRGAAYGPEQAVQGFRAIVADFERTFGDDHGYTDMAREELSTWEAKAHDASIRPPST